MWHRIQHNWIICVGRNNAIVAGYGQSLIGIAKWVRNDGVEKWEEKKLERTTVFLSDGQHSVTKNGRIRKRRTKKSVTHSFVGERREKKLPNRTGIMNKLGGDDWCEVKKERNLDISFGGAVEGTMKRFLLENQRIARIDSPNHFDAR